MDWLDERYDSVKFTGTNRDTAMTPKLSGNWCMSCDMRYVRHGAKCPYCGNWNGRKTLKKDTNA